MNSTTGLHVACQAATVNLPFDAGLRRISGFSRFAAKQGGSAALAASAACQKAECLLLAQLKQMQTARFLCSLWGKSIRPNRALCPFQLDPRTILPAFAIHTLYH
jgi:hypothetical protein